MNDRFKPTTSIFTTTLNENCQKLQLTDRLSNWIKNQDSTTCHLSQMHFKNKDTIFLKA